MKEVSGVGAQRGAAAIGSRNIQRKTRITWSPARAKAFFQMVIWLVAHLEKQSRPVGAEQPRERRGCLQGERKIKYVVCVYNLFYFMCQSAVCFLSLYIQGESN
jgi:hypothetical protein